jgi:hypothetical protein
LALESLRLPLPCVIEQVNASHQTFNSKQVYPPMTRKLFLLIFMLIPLMGAIVTGTPTPVLLAMGGLILIGLTVASLREQP